MLAIITLLVVLSLSLFVTRLGAMILMLTGLSKESARFQSRSAFTGVGFTTNESESVMNHPVRRRIVMSLMLAGNLGIATVVSTLILSFVSTAKADHWWWNALLLVCGGLVLLFLSTNKTIEVFLNKLICFTLKKYTKISVKDYVGLLNLQKGYVVSEMLVSSNDWIAGKTIIEAALSKEGILILGIQRQKGVYIGAPQANTKILSGDVLILYSTVEKISKLDQRRKGTKGQEAREEAVEDHQEDIESKHSG